MRHTATFIVDKITNSIEEANTGVVFDTDVTPVTKAEINTILKKNGWFFNWSKEFKIDKHQVFKLTTKNDSQIQGIVSIKPQEGYIEMYLLENAPHNFGVGKKYLGVAGNLVAFVCKTSYDLGFDGCIAFTAKTNLVIHYQESLGAELIYGNERMGIFESAAKKLVNSYFKGYVQ